jgi:hypothetical protein
VACVDDAAGAAGTGNMKGRAQAQGQVERKAAVGAVASSDCLDGYGGEPLICSGHHDSKK